MKLNDWIKTHPHKKRGIAARQLAEQLGVSEVSVRKYAAGERQVPVDLLISMYELTGRAVHPSDMRPDVGKVAAYIGEQAAA